jgi:hypothetical protein
VAIADAYYYGHPRQNIAVQHVDQRIIVFLEDAKKPEASS